LTHPEEFSGKFVLELAAGTGITSVAAAELAEDILCTGIFYFVSTLVKTVFFDFKVVKPK
jgi:predicted nicotinamide N-methyase